MSNLKGKVRSRTAHVNTRYNDQFTCGQRGWHGCTLCWVWIPLEKEKKWDREICKL